MVFQDWETDRTLCHESDTDMIGNRIWPVNLADAENLTFAIFAHDIWTPARGRVLNSNPALDIDVNAI